MDVNHLNIILRVRKLFLTIILAFIPVSTFLQDRVHGNPVSWRKTTE